MILSSFSIDVAFFLQNRSVFLFPTRRSSSFRHRSSDGQARAEPEISSSGRCGRPEKLPLKKVRF